MRHVWTKKPRGQRLAGMVQVEDRKIHGCRTSGREYGLWEIRAWEKLGPSHMKTWKVGAYIPTPREMGVRKESASGAASHSDV